MKAFPGKFLVSSLDRHNVMRDCPTLFDSYDQAVLFCRNQPTFFIHQQINWVYIY